MRRQQEQTLPTFEFRIDETAGTCGDVIDAVAALLIDIHTKTKNETAKKQAEGDE